jgi:hypothetical protein
MLCLLNFKSIPKYNSKFVGIFCVHFILTISTFKGEDFKECLSIAWAGHHNI